MADFMMDALPSYPVTSTVQVYPEQAIVNGSGPTSAPVTSAVVSAAGVLTFSGLAEDVPYVAAQLQSGAWRLKRFSVSVPDRDLHTVDTTLLTVETNVARKVAKGEEWVNAFDALAVTPFTAIVGNGVADDAAALNNLTRIHKGKKILIPPYTPSGARTVLRYTTQVTVQSETTLVMEGVKLKPDGVTAHTIFLADTDAGGVVTTPSFSGVGATSQALTATAVKKATTVTIATGQTIANDTPCAVWDDSLLGGIAYRKERNVVKSYNSGTGVVTLKEPLNFNYGNAAVEPEVTASGTATSGMGTNPRLLIITPVTNVHITGGEFDMSLVASSGGGADRSAIAGYWADNCTVEHYWAYSHIYKPCDFTHAYRTRVTHGRSMLPGSGGAGLGYGPARFTYSRHCGAEWMWAESPGNAVVDITGGSDISVDHVVGVARRDPADFEVGIFCHGLFEQRITANDIRAVNLTDGIGCGNGTFGPTVDSTFTNVVTYGCDRGVFINSGCRGIRVQGSFYDSTERAVAVQDSTDIEVAPYINGNQSATLAAITVAGTCADIRIVKPTIRGTLGYKAITVTQVAGAGKVKILDPDIDMGATAQPAIECTLLKAGGSVIIKRGEITTAYAAGNAILLSGPADYVEVEGVEFVGAMLRCVHVLGLPKKVRIRRNDFATSTSSAAAVRIEDVGDAAVADTLALVDNHFNMSGGSTIAIQLLNTVLSSQGNVADVHANRYGSVTTKIQNTAAATLRGLVDILTGTATWDPGSLIVGAQEKKSVTVTGAAVGDPAAAGLTTIAAVGWEVIAAVVATNTVEVTIKNNTAGTVDLGSGTVRATVWKHS